jgi:multidrug efflux pump
MFSRFFIDRPIFAWVLSITTMLAGAAAIWTLPVAQYPDIAPPTVTISATFPGASAETLETSVTQIIEQQLTGIDGLLYFSSSSRSDGSARITVTFEKGTDPDIAQVQVQNKVQQAVSRLPQQVQQQGLTVSKSQNDFLLVIVLADISDRVSSTDLADTLIAKFQDPLARVEGVGQTQVFGSQHAMRIWLDPVKLGAVALMPSDVTAALAAQDAEISAGQIGQRPALTGQQLNVTVTARGRLQTPEQFRNVIVKTQTDGAIVRLSDVARVEIGNENYDASPRFDGHPAAGIALQLAPGASALRTVDAVKARVAELANDLPTGYAIGYERDTSDFVRRSVREVLKTLLEAIAIVVVVMFVFLQSWRATLIPAIAVPVVLLGTFGVLSLLGYSINSLTLFGMVLSIGLLVDDAIVVVENVERLMRDEQLSARDATAASMTQISGALVGIALVLSVVLLPMAFFGGSTGVIYRQFSVTIVSSMVLSTLVALTLTPALCAQLLRPTHTTSSNTFFAWFNSAFLRLSEHTTLTIERLLGKRGTHLTVYGLLVLTLYLCFAHLPTGFLPLEDQGQVMFQYNLPAGATTERTLVVAERVERFFLGDERTNTQGIFDVPGMTFNGAGQNAGIGFATLASSEIRADSANSAEAIAARATTGLSSLRDADVFVMVPPSIPGLGQSNGFTFELLNTGGLDRETFLERRDQLLAAARNDPSLTAVRAAALEDNAQLHIDIDEEKLAVLGLAMSDVSDTLSAAWGGIYVNDFVEGGRVKRVYVQSDAAYRAQPSDLDRWFVRSASTGAMTPFSAFASTRWMKGPTTVSRFNGLASHEIQGSAAAGTSSGEAMEHLLALQAQLDSGTDAAWSGLSYQERSSNQRAPILYAVSALIVFLCLAALYESWSVPFAVLLEALPAQAQLHSS